MDCRLRRWRNAKSASSGASSMANGGRDRTRTCDHADVSRALCRLSYAPRPPTRSNRPLYEMRQTGPNESRVRTTLEPAARRPGTVLPRVSIILRPACGRFSYGVLYWPENNLCATST
jgi:hypothetical protein